MAKRVLFLDIDGVLNRDGTKERCNGFIGVDRELARRLLDWLNTTDVKIVLSSTWRNHPDMHPHLEEAGIRWIDITPRLPGVRGNEIHDWLGRHREVVAYAILDDNSDMLPDQKPRFVQTKTHKGLQPEHIEQLKALFGITE